MGKFSRKMSFKGIRLVLLGVLFSTGLLFAADEEESTLHGKMEEVNRSLKLLRRAGDDYGKAAELVQQAQVVMLECFHLVPELVENMPEGKEKAVAMANYRKLMAESYKKLCDLELAYLSEDLDRIDDVLDEVKGSRKNGHQEFIEPEG